MPDYKTMYHKAFNALTDADRLLERAREIIFTAHQECEDIYVAGNDTPLSLTGGKEP